jgi:hypothetical protein
MCVRGPELFYSVRFIDDYGFYPARDLWVSKGWSVSRCLEFAMGARPVSIQTIHGYGAYLEHEDFWIFGQSPSDVERVAAEWPID